MEKTIAKRGRPKVSALTRAEQLRLAKRAQRERERNTGLATIELRLPAVQAEKLRVATRTPGFEAALHGFLEDFLVDIQRWPALRELAWNRVDRWIPAEEALSLYERNWRFVDPAHLSTEERALIDRLTERHGGGVRNA